MEDFVVVLDPEFPRAEVERIASRLMSLNSLVPGFIPPEIGLLDIRALTYSEHIEGIATILLVDRNLASRMAQLAAEGTPKRWDLPTEFAINLMAFAQAMNLDIEPGLAFHELGFQAGNEAAHDELGWFRAADRGAARKWIDMATQRALSLDVGPAALAETHDLKEPPGRWVRNHVAALKTARLALERGRTLQSLLALLDWMMAGFILAGPAFLYAARFFGPRAANAGMFKNLRAAEREKALKGVRNAAWDITYLSEFGRLAGLRDTAQRQFIFASADRALVELAGAMFCGPEATDDHPALVDTLGRWWPAADARRICDRYFECVEAVGPGRNRGTDLSGDPLADMTASEETWLRAWSGRAGS